MRVLRLIGFSALLLTLAACGSSGIPVSVNYATLNFTVTDAATSAAIAGASVAVNTVLTATTSSAGTASVYPVPPGKFDYSVSAPGYQPLTNQEGTVAPGQALSLPVQLHR
ncbi:carboxypeptidase regulatory-like domain-containing protein [bacterium]|nr:MAG: carboxypeptidase regulatory-like domain-containing protein [bacterium]